jgi:3-phenylpropionate/trans-cinnamate dioxygenase ferredoxin reductase subunit
VDVVEIYDGPLVRMVGPEIGAVLEAIHREHGVRFHFGQTVSSFLGDSKVRAVLTDEGERVEADFVVVAVGIEPELGAVAGSGIAIDNGVLVDAGCRTNVDGVFAAGDVANLLHPLFGRRIRVEHYDNALKQGTAAARSMLRDGVVFDDPYWFWSDQYEHNLQYLGNARAWDDFIVRGSFEERRFLGFYVRDGLVDAVVGLNRGRDVRRAAGLIRARRPVDPGLLRDEDVDLKQLGARLQAEGGA